MIRQLLIIVITLAVLAGSLVAASATLRERDENLRGYVDPTQDANLPYRIPRLGVNAELTKYSPVELPEQLDMMRQAHMTWVRQVFRWDAIEAQAGEFAWEQYDAVVKPFADDPELKLVAVLLNTPDWARESDSETAPPSDPAAFRAFARAFAERYGATIDFYQIWDEPNLSANWGESDPRPAEYLALLQAGYETIHGADANATVIAAALAPTTEIGPANVSDIRYLSDMYALGAAPYMDAVAGKSYGFNDAPNDRTVREDRLNFSRMVALREVMVTHGDGKKALWASAWGWNALPDDWTGAPSIWGSVTAEQKSAYTLGALERAEREWPWLGGMVLQHWQPDAPADDPQWGFVLMDAEGIPSALWAELAARRVPDAATNGLYFPANDYTQYSGVWTFGALGADIGWVQDSQLDFRYVGNDVALLVREDDYTAFLYPTVDGEPANALPRDAAGNAVLSLTSDTRLPETSLVPVARGMGTGEHTLHIAADRGWDRWALAGFAVSSGDLAPPYNQQISVALVTAIISALATVVTVVRFDWTPLRQRTAGVWQALGNAGQIAVSVVTSLALMVAMLLTWSEAVPNLFRREPVQLGLAILSAGLIYVQPHVVVMLAALVVLFVMIYHRLELGLMLTLFYAPFFLFPVALYRLLFPMAELMILVMGAAWLLRVLASWGQIRQSDIGLPRHSVLSQLTTLDYGVVALVVLGVVSLTWAEQTGRAVTELRTMIAEPALFYLIVRTTARDRQILLRLVDALLIAGVVVAGIGLYQFVRGEAVITAEEGARRLASVYGSPNNVGLFLGRCIPFLLAFVLIRVDSLRRVLAGIGLIVMLAAVLLSQSAGALLIGVPVAAAAVLLLALGRRGLIAVAGLVVVGGAGLAVALRSARFARILDFSEGTNFFRLRVWQSAVEMILDHPITGIGLDQFLYFYRGRYMLPDAWQEPNLSHPHNFLLDFWLRLGILGLLVFVWVQAAFWRQAVRLYKAVRIENGLAGGSLTFALVVGMIGSMVNLLAHGLVDNSVFVNDLAYVFMFLLALNANLSTLELERKDDNA
jgi:O-antigen ligase